MAVCPAGYYCHAGDSRPRRRVQRRGRRAKGRADAPARAREARARAELDECTFAPRQKKCPAYIRRIAEGHRAHNAQRRQKENKGQRPGWR